MAERPMGLTREQIMTQFTPKNEKYEIEEQGKKRPVEALVSRNDQGRIVFVVPLSARFLDQAVEAPVRRLRGKTE